MSKFVVVQDNKVLGVFDGQKFGDGRNCVDVPDDCPIQQGQDVREFDAANDWTLRPLKDRVEAGLVQIDPHLKVVGESLQRKSQVSLILDNVEEIPVGHKLVPAAEAPETFPVEDGYAIVPKTPYEMMAEGIIDTPKGKKLVTDTTVFGGYRLEDMTLEDRVAAGELTDAYLFEIRRRQVRQERDVRIQRVEWRRNRYNDETALGLTPTEPLEPILQYIQALRNIPQHPGFPDNVIWPEEP
jgi:hypothetical protein